MGIRTRERLKTIRITERKPSEYTERSLNGQVECPVLVHRLDGKEEAFC